MGLDTPSSNSIAIDKPARIRDMFGAIVPRYDLINTLMTLGLDRRWRRVTVAMAEPQRARVLDIATGTGELAFELARQGAMRVIGADFCREMVVVARRKLIERERLPNIAFMVGDAMRLPFADATFDAIVN